MSTLKSIRIRTFVIPLVMMLIHAIIISTVSNLYAVLYPAISMFVVSVGWTPWASYATTEQLILTEYPRIAVIASLGLIPLYGIILVFRRLEDPNAIWTRRPTWSQIWPTLVIATGLLGVTNSIFYLLQILSPQFPAIKTAMTDYLATAEAFSPSIGYVWLTLGIAILAPISEELLFRGIIQGELRRAMPEWLAIVIQGILFALFHAQPIQISYVILPALALGALYALTRSIWIPILVHIVFNFLGSIVPAVVGNDQTLLQIVSITELAFAGIGIFAFASMIIRRRET